MQITETQIAGTRLKMRLAEITLDTQKEVARSNSASISRSYGFLTAQWSSPIRSAFRLVSCSLPHCGMCEKNCRRSG